MSGVRGVSADAEKELALLLRSGYRLIALETFEEDRAIRLVERVALSDPKAERAVHTWSLASGLDRSGEGAGSLAAGAEALRKVEGPAIFVVLDAHAVLEDPVAIAQ